MNNNVEALNKMDMHDLCVLKLNFNFEEKTFAFEVNLFGKEDKVIGVKKFEFYNVSKFKSQEFLFKDFEKIELYSCDVFESDGQHLVELQFLLGIGEPSLDVSFESNEVKIIDSIF